MKLHHLLPHLILVGAVLVLWLVFLVRRLLRGPYRIDPLATPNTYRSLLVFVAESGYWALDHLIRLFVALRLSPNHVTALSTVVGLAAAACFALGRFALAAWLVILSGLLDSSDGWLARRTGRMSKLGGFIDSCLDRVVDVFPAGEKDMVRSLCRSRAFNS